jgi:hypothetical protein
VGKSAASGGHNRAERKKANIEGQELPHVIVLHNPVSDSALALRKQ